MHVVTCTLKVIVYSLTKGLHPAKTLKLLQWSFIDMWVYSTDDKNVLPQTSWMCRR